MKKNKNTYIVKLNNIIATPELFELCKNTPMPVQTLNGAPYGNPSGGWITGKEFPNPCAQTMVREYKDPDFKGILGEKISSTIIEYLDKNTKKPVIYIFPSSIHIMCEDDSTEEQFLSAHLNHASRRDYMFQKGLRFKLLNEYYNKRNH